MESRQHKQIANNIAQIKGSEYHSDEGIDIRTPTQAIEVEVDSAALGHAKQQLAGTIKTPYIAVPKKLIDDALEAVSGTRFGVMDEKANIVRRGRGR